LKRGDIVVMDDVPLHRTRGVREALEAHGVTVPEFPAYSPDLNPIEQPIGKLPAIEARSSVRIRRGERGIWQRRYWEHTIRDDGDYAAHMDYIHFNPVKHGLAHTPADWPFSSFRRCVARGFYPLDWLGGGAEPLEAGERP
jgi:hypothetical protein